MRDKDKYVRMFSAISAGLALLGTGKLEDIDPLLKAKDRYVRRGSAIALGLTLSGVKEGVGSIEPLTIDEDSSVRTGAGFSLNLPFAPKSGSLISLGFRLWSHGGQYGWWFGQLEFWLC